MKTIIITGFGCNKNAYQELAEQLDSSTILYPSESNIKLTEPTTIIGHSLGGQVALMLAMLYPQYVERVITYASTPCFMEKADWLGLEQATLDELKANIHANPKAALFGFHRWQLTGATNARAKLKALMPTEFNVQQLISELDMLEQNDLRGQGFDFETQHFNSKDDVIVNAGAVQREWGDVSVIESGSHSFLLEKRSLSCTALSFVEGSKGRPVKVCL